MPVTLWEDREPSKWPQTSSSGQWRRIQDTEPDTGKEVVTLLSPTLQTTALSPGSWVLVSAVPPAMWPRL